MHPQSYPSSPNCLENLFNAIDGGSIKMLKKKLNFQKFQLK